MNRSQKYFATARSAMLLAGFANLVGGESTYMTRDQTMNPRIRLNLLFLLATARLRDCETAETIYDIELKHYREKRNALRLNRRTVLGVHHHGRGMPDAGGINTACKPN